MNPTNNKEVSIALASMAIGDTCSMYVNSDELIYPRGEPIHIKKVAIDNFELTGKLKNGEAYTVYTNAEIISIEFKLSKNDSESFIDSLYGGLQ